MATATELRGKRVTVFGTIATVTGVGLVQRNYETSIDEGICVLTDKDGHTHRVLASVVEALPETISRDSFGYRP